MEYGLGTNFHNQSWNYFVQLAYRPSLANQQWIRNLEAVGRFSQLQFPHDAPWSKEGTEWAIGMNYWLTWNALVKVAWIGGGAESGAAGGHGGHGAAAEGGHVDGKLAVQMAMGL